MGVPVRLARAVVPVAATAAIAGGARTVVDGSALPNVWSRVDIASARRRHPRSGISGAR
jgi:hypothetical protein